MLSILLLGATMGVAQAQTESGKVLLNSTINYSRFNNESNTTGSVAYPTNVDNDYSGFNFNFSPKVGLFVADNLAVGLDLGGGTGSRQDNRTEYNNTDNTFLSYNIKQTSRQINLGPFVRYYKMLGEKAGLYGQLTGGYLRRLEKQRSEYVGNPSNDYSNETETRGGYASFSPGFVYFPSKKFGIDLAMGGFTYNKSKSETHYDSAGQGSSTNTGSSLAANFGIQYVSVGASLYLGN